MQGPLLALASSCAITLAMLVAALVLWLRARRFARTAARATGTVISQPNGRRDTSGRPWVRFVTHTGATIEFRDSSGGDSPGFAAGEPVPVLYDPANPGRARIVIKPRDLYFAPLLLGGLGGLFAALLCAMAALMAVLFRMWDVPL